MQGQKLKEFPYLFKWFEKVGARPAVKRGLDIGKVMRNLRNAGPADNSKEARKTRAILFNQKSR